MKAPVRWGILGTGYMAGNMARALAALPGAELAAVGSRALDSARAFAARHGVARCHGSYAELAADPCVDVAYVATPTPLHRQNVLACLEAGKAVLCEKPLAVNAAEAEEMAAAARRRGALLVEALWSRFIPAWRWAEARLREGAIGDVRMVHADFGFRADAADLPRWTDPALAGGALMHVGVYPVALATAAFGAEPMRVEVMATAGPGGADQRAGMLLGYPDGGLAVLSCAVSARTPRHGEIMGAEGMLRLHEPFWRPPAATLSIPGRPDQTVELPIAGNGYTHQAAAMMDAFRAGVAESPVMPLDFSVAVMRTMDALRARLGMRFPCEAASAPAGG